MRQYRSAGVLCLTEVSSVFSGDHLRVDVRLGAVDLADVLNVSRADLAVQVKCAVSVADNGLSDGDPWVVVAEDTSILFVSRRIGGNLTKIQVILGVSRCRRTTPYLVSRMFWTEVRAFSASPSLTPISARTQKPCGSM